MKVYLKFIYKKIKMNNPNTNQTQNNPGVEEFLHAVNMLFHSTDRNVKNEANKFLISFEKRADSWDVAYQVLIKDNLKPEEYFNALQILKNKIKYDFGNYSENPEYIEKLLSFLLSNINRFKDSEHYMLLNYCDCIGKAFLFTGDKFKNILKEYTVKLSANENDMNSLISLLLIFYYINETSHDKKMVIDEQARDIFRENVENISDDVFQYLNFLLSKLNTVQNINLKKFISGYILDTFTDYISNYKLSDEIILKFNDVYQPIINFIFQIDEENLDKHSECICNLLQLPLEKNNMRNLAQNIFGKVLTFKDALYKTLDSLDSEQIGFYIDVFTSMVQNNFSEIINEKRYDLIQIIVDLTKNCPTTKIDEICEFFENFNRFLYEENYSIHQIFTEFSDIFTKFLYHLINLTKFNEEIFKKLNISKAKKLKNEDDYNTTIDYRESIRQFLESFVEYYGFNFIFEKVLFPEINKTIEKIKTNLTDLNLWGKLENLLFIFSCISKFIETKNESSFKDVIILFHTIFDIPKDFIQITRTVTDILDDCAQLLSYDKNLLLKGFKYLVNGLENPLVLKYCSLSCGNLLSKNKKIMAEIRVDLLNLYNDKLKDKILTNDKYLYIVEGIAEAVCYSTGDNTDYDIIKNSIIQILRPWVLFLQEAKLLVEKNNSLSPDEDQKLNELLIVLKSISKAIFKGLNDSNKKIMNEILNEIWPKIIFILNKLSTNNDIVENSIQLIKCYMRGLDKNFINYIQEYLECLINGYKLTPISSYLYGLEILITVFPKSNDDSLKKILSNTFNNLCYITFNNYLKSEYDLSICVQIGEDFYGMLYRIMKMSPFLILESNVLENLISSAINYMDTTQIQISKNIMIFIQNIISYKKLAVFINMEKDNNKEYEKYKNILANEINKFSDSLCQKILKIFIDWPPEIVLETLCELLKNFIIYQKNLALVGFEKCLKDFPSDILTNIEKKKFLELIQNFEERERDFDRFIDNMINRCISKQKRDKGDKN